MISATVTESKADNGTAALAGKIHRSNGTATIDSPKPNVDRTSVAMKLMTIIKREICEVKPGICILKLRNSGFGIFIF